MPLIRGIIFDLDGTLVDSRLDFDRMRLDMGLPAGVPILEALASVPHGPDRTRMLGEMRRHELLGADLAVIYDGVTDFLQQAHAADERYTVRDGINIGRFAIKLRSLATERSHENEALETAILHTLGEEALRHVRRNRPPVS